MTATATMKWMTETMTDGVNMKDIWLVPQNKINTGMVYAGWPVGKSPEFMPWESSLNADMKRLYDYHCVVTNK